ncbi:MAG: sigma-70 region 4 domain-containing protein, partial [Muribaculaceae bacterium]|nr:sigma-70 region 4 domain-containing protein [Muribaculaceae bacterium]
LSERDREILLLRDHSGWEFEEIAERFDMTPAAVRMALSRARKGVLKAYRERTHRHI